MNTSTISTCIPLYLVHAWGYIDQERTYTNVIFEGYTFVFPRRTNLATLKNGYTHVYGTLLYSLLAGVHLSISLLARAHVTGSRASSPNRSHHCLILYEHTSHPFPASRYLIIVFFSNKEEKQINKSKKPKEKNTQTTAHLVVVRWARGVDDHHAFG
jgi:hypothetical protein